MSGTAIQALSRFNDALLYIANSTFGGKFDLGNTGSNNGRAGEILLGISAYSDTTIVIDEGSILE